MKGCVLFGRFVFSDESKNRPASPARRRPDGARDDGSDESSR
jgi:hypothetical protein